MLVMLAVATVMTASQSREDAASVSYDQSVRCAGLTQAASYPTRPITIGARPSRLE